MRRVVWALGWAGIVVWSLVCALAYGFFELVGRLFMRNADAFSSDADTVESIFRAFSWVHGLSTWAVLVVWAFVSLMILAVPWVFDRMVGTSRPADPGARPGRPMGRGRAGPGNVIDLAPDQYRVRPEPGPGAAGGPAARITPPGR